MNGEYQGDTDESDAGGEGRRGMILILERLHYFAFYGRGKSLLYRYRKRSRGWAGQLERSTPQFLDDRL
jgi:hypothetical protein